MPPPPARPAASTETDAWFQADRPRRDALLALRALLLDLGLGETIKWRQPCYTVEGRNIAILSARKDACVIGVFQGALIDDPEGHLESAGPNTRAGRVLRFDTVENVRAREASTRHLLRQAIALERAGERVESAPPSDPIPVELTAAFHDDPALQAAFEALTPGRQRGYLLHFNGAKQAATRTKRIDGARDRILAGIGINDCHCGRSARMPRCDGTHRTPIAG